MLFTKLFAHWPSITTVSVHKLIPEFKKIHTFIAIYLSDAGVLIVILNYTGDVLNFGLAVEKAKTHVIQVTLPKFLVPCLSKVCGIFYP